MSSSVSSLGSDSESLPPYSAVVEQIDCEVFFDASMSMTKKANKSSASKLTRFEQGEEVGLQLLRDFLKLDDDGITIGFFNRKFEMRQISSVQDALDYYERIEEKVQSGTKLAPLLVNRFDDFRKVYAKNKRRRVIVIITDGATKDFDDAVAVIRDMANWSGLPDHKALGVLFVLVGDSSSGREMMTALDDNKTIPPFKHDIIDCKTVAWMEEEGRTITEVIAQAFED